MEYTFWLASFTAIAFFYYGLTCLFSNKMMSEFIRFGLNDRLRIITGLLQLAGALGIFMGLKLPLLGMMATFGLSILMLLGFITRLKINDPFKESVPSFAFMVINAYLFYAFALQLQMK
ncbi:MAG: DoxX family protein [Fulvivirga sp.]|uniref:DoxX family protein n=1 Tax=Fulvivirga sp. TaxID=1931237 RepID=UPI0032EF1724